MIGVFKKFVFLYIHNILPFLVHLIISPDLKPITKSLLINDIEIGILFLKVYPQQQNLMYQQYQHPAQKKRQEVLMSLNREEQQSQVYILLTKFMNLNLVT